MFEEAGAFENSRRFYEKYVAPMIHERFGKYENRIAVGLAGEGSDCFGYDDFISRDHDFGTGVCLWLADTDMQCFGAELSAAYSELADLHGGKKLSVRLSERRGVMSIHDFYSNILCIDCDTKGCTLTTGKWMALDHSCLATAVNGVVFRDDLGEFTAFRNMLLKHYPDDVLRYRLADELHGFSSALQVNYARSMCRKDTVAAALTKDKGIRAAMELFFLLKKTYPPYYKWTFRRLSELDKDGSFAEKIKRLSEAGCSLSKWENRPYDPNSFNFDDPVVVLTEQIAADINRMLRERGLTKCADPYLERYVNEILP